MKGKLILFSAMLMLPGLLCGQNWSALLENTNIGAPKIVGGKVYKVEYRAYGILVLENNRCLLRTEAGRQFLLKLGPFNINKIRTQQLLGKKVYVQGFVPSIADQSEMLVARVDLEGRVPREPRVIIDNEKPVILLKKEFDSYHIGNVRYGRTKDKNGAEKKDANGDFVYTMGELIIHPSKLKQAYIGSQSYILGGMEVPTHGFAFFAFEPGGLTDVNGKDMPGLAFSLSGYSRKHGENGEFDKKAGIQGGYRVVYQVTTIPSYLDDHQFAPCELYPLEISLPQQRKFMTKLVDISFIDKSEEVYNLLTNSCVNTLMVTLNDVLYSAQKMEVHPFAKMIAPTLSDVDNPLFQIEITEIDFAISYLQRKDLLGTRYVKLEPDEYDAKPCHNFYPFLCPKAIAAKATLGRSIIESVAP